jgi:catechol 2,3-dioxygenase-like lactoylglutathione lyase family enzyme
MQDAWPSLSYAEWKGACETLHLWTQVVGKVRLARTPWLNHSWHAPLYVTARGLSTGAIHCGARVLDIEFDFIDSRLVSRTDSACATVPLEPMTVAEFHRRVMAALDQVEEPTRIHGAPNELPLATPFAEDHAPRVYDPSQAERFWRALLQADRVMKLFRTGFLGKASPVHFFWGSFDLAVTRFSGRRAPLHPGGVPNLPDAVAQEAYSHEAFYSYAYPAPEGFAAASVQPSQARFDTALGEFILPYEAVRTAADPDAALLAFLESTYAAAADLAAWDRQGLEAPLGQPGRPRAL